MGGVLVIDDDEDLLGALSDLIAALSQRPCLTMRSLAELVSAAPSALECDLAVVDINLGSGEPTGIDVYEWLRARGFRGRIVFLTGHAFSHPLVQRACALGHARVLRKPIGVVELRALLDEYDARSKITERA